MGGMWSVYFVLLVFAVAGLWFVWQPQRVLIWWKVANKQVDVDDPFLLRFVRVTGFNLIIFPFILYRVFADSLR